MLLDILNLFEVFIPKFLKRIWYLSLVWPTWGREEVEPDPLGLTQWLLRLCGECTAGVLIGCCVVGRALIGCEWLALSSLTRVGHINNQYFVKSKVGLGT